MSVGRIMKAYKVRIYPTLAQRRQCFRKRVQSEYTVLDA